MKRRGVGGPQPEMPATLRVFDVSAWPSRQAWTQARIAWCTAHDVDFVEVLRQDVKRKRAICRRGGGGGA